jgi:hypothetical protein
MTAAGVALLEPEELNLCLDAFEEAHGDGVLWGRGEAFVREKASEETEEWFSKFVCLSSEIVGDKENRGWQ